MSDDCPNCERPSIGGQIVELPHPHEGTTIAAVCPHCGTVFQSAHARKQVRGGE